MTSPDLMGWGIGKNGFGSQMKAISLKGSKKITKCQFIPWWIVLVAWQLSHSPDMVDIVWSLKYRARVSAGSPPLALFGMQKISYEPA